MLERIQKANDIKKLAPEELPELAQEIRQFLIEKISHTGGHLASNLGVVELTIALFRTFDLPEDKIIWDVGHQSYTHKILSGRRMEFDELRQYGGLSGFPKRKESPYDSFDTGHSSTSISAGLGIAQGRDILGEDYKVVSVIGDGALTGGMAYEALNNAARMKKNFIIILNDNKMSISENVLDSLGNIDILLEAIKNWERLRFENRFPDELKEELRKPETEWHLKKVDDHHFELYPMALSQPFVCDLLEMQPGQPGGADWYFENCFEEIINDSNIVYEDIVRNLNPKYKAALSFDGKNSICMHVRLGDFARVSWEEVKSGKHCSAIPIEWYVCMGMALRQIIGEKTKIYVFSDGTDEELKPLLQLENVERITFGSAIADILALANSGIFVASGSSFSMWARYLGRMTAVMFPNQVKQKILQSYDQGKEIVAFDKISLEDAQFIKKYWNQKESSELVNRDSF